jgi:hypothetical protein
VYPVCTSGGARLPHLLRAASVEAAAFAAMSLVKFVSANRSCDIPATSQISCSARRDDESQPFPCARPPPVSKHECTSCGPLSGGPSPVRATSRRARSRLHHPSTLERYSAARRRRGCGRQPRARARLPLSDRLAGREERKRPISAADRPGEREFLGLAPHALLELRDLFGVDRRARIRDPFSGRRVEPAAREHDPDAVRLAQFEQVLQVKSVAPAR